MTDIIKTMSLGPFNVLVNEQGYINGSMICTQFKKRMPHWKTQASTKALINSLANKLNVKPSDLILFKNNLSNEHRGTYVHPNLIISILRWCSCDYDIALNEIIYKTLSDQNIDIHIISSKDAGKIDNRSGIYLIELGCIDNVGNFLNIKDKYPGTYVAYKYGMSVNIKSRFKTHKKNYSEMNGFKPKLVYSQYIDCRFRLKAEKDLQNLFIDLNVRITSKKYFEIIVIPLNMMNVIKAMYDSVAFKYQI